MKRMSVTGATDKGGAPSSSALLHRLGWFCVLVFVASLPWDLFQRFPFTTMTISKAAGLLIVVVAAALCVIRRTIPRTYLEVPLAVLALAFAMATVVSSDPGASVATLARYVEHAILFYAVVVCVQTAGDARTALAVYCFSAVCVASLALLCKAGVLLPTDWQTTTFPYSGRLIEQAQNGAGMRMVATSPDLNQGALFLLIAFALCWQRPTRTGAIAPGLWPLAPAMLLLALFVSQSRSGLLCAMALICFSVGRYCQKKGRSALGIVAVVAVIGGLAMSGPIARWIDRPDSSVSSRMHAYRAALHAVPAHLVVGMGPGASDEVLARSEYGDAIAGQTVHSVPLKILIETGILGLAGYLFLWWRLGAVTWRTFAVSSDPEDRRLGVYLLSMGFVIFAMQFVQPFTILPHYPVLIGLWCGAMASKTKVAHAPARHAALDLPLVTVATVLVLALALVNVWLYQISAKRVIAYASRLSMGPELEGAARWKEAERRYQEALDIALPKSDAAQFISLDTFSLGQVPFYDALSVVIDVPQIANHMNSLSENPDPVALCRYGIGRAALAQGKSQYALEEFVQALEIDSDLADVHFVLAETYWGIARYGDALEHYRHAARLADEWRNLNFRFRSKEWDARILALEGATGIRERLEQANLLRQRGRWEDAVAIYRQVHETSPQTREAEFALGVDAALHESLDQTREYGRQASDS